MASFKVKYFFNFTFESEAIRANLHGNKRILKWRPFWNKVYRDLTSLPRMQKSVFVVPCIVRYFRTTGKRSHTGKSGVRIECKEPGWLATDLMGDQFKQKN